MDNLYGYEILNDKIKNSKYYFPYNEIITKNLKNRYKYYIFVKEYNMENEYYTYSVLLSNKKFNENCKETRYDDYGRLRLKVTSTIRDYIVKLKTFDLKYIESNDEYDKYVIE